MTASATGRPRHARPALAARVATRVRRSRRPLAVAAAAGAGAGGVVALGGGAAGAGLAVLAAAAAVAVVGPERLALAAWSVTAAAAPLSGVRVAGVALSDLSLATAVVLTLPSFATGARRRPAAVDPAVYAGLALVAAGGLVGTLFAAHPGASLVRMAAFLIASAGSVGALALWAPSRERLARLCSWWLAGAVLNAAWAVVVSPSVGGRRSGLSTHPNHLGIVCVLGIALALGVVLGGGRRARRLAGAGLVPLVGALLLSGSRGALVGLAVVVPAVAVLGRRVQLAVRSLAVLAVLGLAALAGLVDVPEQSGLGRLLGGRSAAESDAARVEHLSQSLDRVGRHPLTGEGFEFAQEAHNIYLQVLVGAGPLGLAGLALVARSVLRAGWRHGARRSGEGALLAGLAGGYAAYLAVGAFQNALWDRYLWLYAALALVLAGAGGDRPRAGRRAQPVASVAPGPAGPRMPMVRDSSGMRSAR